MNLSCACSVLGQRLASTRLVSVEKQYILSITVAAAPVVYRNLPHTSTALGIRVPANISQDLLFAINSGVLSGLITDAIQDSRSERQGMSQRGGAQGVFGLQLPRCSCAAPARQGLNPMHPPRWRRKQAAVAQWSEPPAFREQRTFETAGPPALGSGTRDGHAVPADAGSP